MKRFRILDRLIRDDAGSSTIEYAMILGLIVFLLFIALSGLAAESTQMWGDISSKSASAMSG